MYQWFLLSISLYTLWLLSTSSNSSTEGLSLGYIFQSAQYLECVGLSFVCINVQVVAAEKASKCGLHEKLTMTVAVPLLWGVPPVSETLHLAVRSGGGIVEKVSWQWDFL